ncbi:MULTISPECIES: GNAT family N-acetyltransferase [unclassified Paenibacillus]|uniref:GNAT family N-acetyltransferase n=1 Tax=unclassified Paenibacillus TaxID=185978 RepID=UPI003640C572
MNITIRPLEVPGDYERMAELLNIIFSEPTWAERLEEDDRKMYKQGKLTYDDDNKLTGYDRIRLAALSPDGLMIGYANSWRAPWTEAGTLHHTLVVDPKYRNKGVGSALAGALEQWAHEMKASEIVVNVADHDESSIAFAQKRGYLTARHAFKSILKPAEFVEASEGDYELRLVSEGIRFFTLLEEPGEESELKLYQLYKQAAADIPGNRESYPNVSEWKKWFLHLEGYRPELVLIAAEGSRYVGVVHLLHNEKTSGMYHEFTGVDREYRGRHIASALKIRAIRLSKLLNVPYMSTHNDSANAPMLAINRNRLGYIASPGNYRMIKELRSD